MSEQPNEEGNYEVTTSICCHGGCSYDMLCYPDERTALLCAAFMQGAGLTVDMGNVCPKYCAEYLSDIQDDYE